MRAPILVFVLCLSAACGVDAQQSASFTWPQASAVDAETRVPTLGRPKMTPMFESQVEHSLPASVWLSQSFVPTLGRDLTRDYGETALELLRQAQRTAGSAVTSGRLEQADDGTFSWSPEGAKLRFSSSEGEWSLSIDALVGDALADGFPREGERLEVTWVWSNGSWSTCTLEHDGSKYSGRFTVSDGREMLVNATRIDSKWRGAAVLDDGGSLLFTTRIEEGARYVSDVDLRIAEGRFTLHHETGAMNEGPPVWRGSIEGEVVGWLRTTPLDRGVALDVFVGEERFRAAVVP